VSVQSAIAIPIGPVANLIATPNALEPAAANLLDEANLVNPSCRLTTPSKVRLAPSANAIAPIANPSNCSACSFQKIPANG
jgi:hypothetical protein